jgi:hypothetical protein
MAAGATYEPISTQTLTSAAASITFSSIPSTYTDLVCVLIGTNSGGANNDMLVQFNSDTATNYSSTYVYGNGTSTGSGRYTSATFIEISQQGSTNPGTSIFNVQNYANTTTYKSLISRGSDKDSKAWASVGLWRSTSAINAIKIYAYSGNLSIGTTATLYGIAAA